MSYLSRLTFKRRIADAVIWLGLELIDPPEIDFIAGQFINLHIGSDDRRTYSICSSPSDHGAIELCISTRSGGAGSRFVEGLQIDDEVSFEGPFGRFMVEAGERSLVFIVTGTGLSPVRSMLLDLMEMGDPRRKLLMFGARNEECVFWADEFMGMQERTDFAYACWLSEPAASWQGKLGRVTAGLKQLGDFSRYDYYLCGVPAMVSDVRSFLDQQHVPATQVHFEQFIPKLT